MAESKTKSKRGFASMDPQRQREIASLGGRAAHASGNAHQFTSEEARAAGARSHARQAQQQAAANAQAGDAKSTQTRMKAPGSNGPEDSGRQQR